MAEVLTFGELMLRLTTPGFQRFGQAAHFEVTFGGAEANVAMMIAQLGGSAGFISRMPRNELADRALGELRGLGVEVGGVVRGGDRLGVYFLEHGVSQRSSKVIYDRAHSAIAEARPEDFRWEEIFSEGVRWFHWSGITPALSPAAVEIVRTASTVARARGVRVSFDLNFRSKLWTLQRAGEVLAPLMEHVDLCVTSAEEARSVFGMALPEGKADRETVIAQGLCARFGFDTVALTMRQAETAETTGWGAMLYTGGQAYFSRVHQVTIVDRIGAGDSFTGALIFALRRGQEPAAAVEFAVAASALQHTVPGDYNRVSLEEVEALAGGAGGGRVQR